MCGYGLRPSQFVFTYGVGSIIETSKGPRLIPDFDQWGEIFDGRSNRDISDFQIKINLHSKILDGNVFAIPTNVLLDKTENTEIYKTIPFPDWGLCVQHGYLFEYDRNRTGCPGCGSAPGAGSEQGVRFVRACPKGHLDDVDWRGSIAHAKSCNSRVYKWNDNDGTLNGISITCTNCKKETTLADVYSWTKYCRGRVPETRGYSEACDQDSQVILRGSSMLRIPYLIPIIAIPGPISRLHEILARSDISNILTSDVDWTKEKLVKKITTFNEKSPGSIPTEDVEVIKGTNAATVEDAIVETEEMIRNRPSNMEKRRGQELRTLRDAARSGYPTDQRVDPYFSVPKNRVRSDDNGNAIMISKRKLRVSPIEKLRVITIQKGYQRLGTEDPDDKGIPHPIREKYYTYNKKKWYPGIEQIGEAVFIDDHDEDLNIVSNSWDKFFRSSGKVEYHPVFVWWHSLAHRLISAISLHSGYSSASIREVIYTDLSSKQPKGGILLYTSQPGGDGSLGGLVSKVTRFERVIEQALADLEFCSNDPLCYEQDVENVGGSGAACYACLHLSETSCSYFNRFLDRKILLDNPL